MVDRHTARLSLCSVASLRGIGRREFVSLLGGASAAWPLAARAQQNERVRRIGALMGGVESDPEWQRRVPVFEQELQRLGWTTGRNLRIDYRWTAGDTERTRTAAVDLVNLMPDLIVAHSSSPRPMSSMVSGVDITAS